MIFCLFPRFVFYNNEVCLTKQTYLTRENVEADFVPSLNIFLRSNKRCTKTSNENTNNLLVFVDSFIHISFVEIRNFPHLLVFACLGHDICRTLKQKRRKKNVKNMIYTETNDVIDTSRVKCYEPSAERNICSQTNGNETDEFLHISIQSLTKVRPFFAPLSWRTVHRSFHNLFVHRDICFIHKTDHPKKNLRIYIILTGSSKFC